MSKALQESILQYLREGGDLRDGDGRLVALLAQKFACTNKQVNKALAALEKEGSIVRETQRNPGTYLIASAESIEIQDQLDMYLRTGKKYFLTDGDLVSELAQELGCDPFLLLRCIELPGVVKKRYEGVMLRGISLIGFHLDGKLLSELGDRDYSAHPLIDDLV